MHQGPGILEGHLRILPKSQIFTLSHHMGHIRLKKYKNTSLCGAYILESLQENLYK